MRTKLYLRTKWKISWTLSGEVTDWARTASTQDRTSKMSQTSRYRGKRRRSNKILRRRTIKIRYWVFLGTVVTTSTSRLKMDLKFRSSQEKKWLRKIPSLYSSSTNNTWSLPLPTDHIITSFISSSISSFK